MKLKTMAIKNLMVKKGCNFTELATTAGIAKKTISLIFKNKRCSFNTAAKLARALNVPLTEIAEE